MSKLTIGCFSSLVGSMSLDFAVKLAETADLEGPVLYSEPEALGLPEVWTRK